MSKNVIIGAGLSGRGYINRLLQLSGETTVFLDREEALIQKLRRDKSYTISFGKERDPLIVDNYTAYNIMDEQALIEAAQAERIFISVGADHVQELLAFLQEMLLQRGNSPIDIIVAENGIQPSSPLAELRTDSRVCLSEAVIFCTTLGNADSLDIFSENLDHLPYDRIALGHELPLYGFVQEMHFSDLLERKIYTYNCISACIAYLGYEKGYTDYAKAANDSEISDIVKRIAEVINRCITRAYTVRMEEQRAFSEMAIRKFQNYNIVDTVERNVRDVKRKLKPMERIRKPLSLIQEQGEYSEDLLKVLAAALLYGIKTGELTQGWEELVCQYTEGMPLRWRQLLHMYVEQRL
ncbi:mannitol-1-phosphate 5-dehydrogenase [[Clostridium] innocuum]|nr:mannitol-1-phosphate 5-dehydrogenase [[Clostridium] innocuum]